MTMDHARSPSDRHPLKPRQNSLLPPIKGGLQHNISDESTKFEPDTNMSRKLLTLSVTKNSSDVDSNPFIIKTKTTEGTLLTGECDRKINKLESLKYKLIQS